MMKPSSYQRMDFISRRIRILIRERMLFALGLTIAIILFIGISRNTYISGITPESFWAAKIDWRNSADVVVAGDSRIYRGVSPSEMESQLPAARVLNFGFASAGYSESYLRAIEEVLTVKTGNKILILGITPHSLTPGAVGDSDFEEYRQRTAKEKLMYRYLGSLLHFFKPIMLDRNQAMEMLRPGPSTTRYFEEYRPDGWVASYKEPEQPGEAIDRYIRQFKKSGPVSSEIIDELVETVEKWRERGIRVYAFRPPSCSEMVELENDLAGFDEGAFVSKFETAGGKWLDFDQNAYHSYDGSHLHRDSAEKLSREIAMRIQSFQLAMDEK